MRTLNTGSARRIPAGLKAPAKDAGTRPAVGPASARRATVVAAALLVLTGPVSAKPRIAVPPALQASAAQCLGEAVRLCPAALSSRDHGLSCILGKRRLLTPPCRSVYDQGLRLLRGEDLHLTLRRPGGR